MDALFLIGFTVTLLVVGYVAGTVLERVHFKDIRQREEDLSRVLATTLEQVPASWRVRDVQLVTGSVVVSLDYFKRFLAGLKRLVGGNVGVYETLLDRGRREALLRMREHAQEQGFDTVINVRLETARLASTSRNGQGTGGIEILAFGTAVRL